MRLQDNGTQGVSTPTHQGRSREQHHVSSVQCSARRLNTLVDPSNSNVMTEYVGPAVLNSTDGRAKMAFVVPPTRTAVIAPIHMDRTNPSHLARAGHSCGTANGAVDHSWTTSSNPNGVGWSPPPRSRARAVTIGTRVRRVGLLRGLQPSFSGSGFHSGSSCCRKTAAAGTHSQVSQRSRMCHGACPSLLTGVQIELPTRHAIFTVGYSRTG